MCVPTRYVAWDDWFSRSRGNIFDKIGTTFIITLNFLREIFFTCIEKSVRQKYLG